MTSESTNNGAISEPNNFILDDITKWRDVLKKPDYSGVDWEAMAKKDLQSRFIQIPHLLVDFCSNAKTMKEIVEFIFAQS